MSATKLTRTDVVQKVVGWIMAGKVDRYLEAIAEAVRKRRSQIMEAKRMENLVKLGTPGTRVRLSQEARPKYLAGMLGTVIERPAGWTRRHKPDTIYVELDYAPSGNRFSRTLGCPATLLEAANEEE